MSWLTGSAIIAGVIFGVASLGGRCRASTTPPSRARRGWAPRIGATSPDSRPERRRGTGRPPRTCALSAPDRPTCTGRSTPTSPKSFHAGDRPAPGQAHRERGRPRGAYLGAQRQRQRRPGRPPRALIGGALPGAGALAVAGVQVLTGEASALVDPISAKTPATTRTTSSSSLNRCLPEPLPS